MSETKPASDEQIERARNHSTTGDVFVLSLIARIEATERSLATANELLEKAMPRIDDAAIEWVKLASRHRRAVRIPEADASKAQAKECAVLISAIRTHLEKTK